MSTNTTHISIGRLYPKLTFYIYSQPGSGMYSKMKLDLQSIGTNLALTYIKCVPVFPEWTYCIDSNWESIPDLHRWWDTIMIPSRSRCWALIYFGNFFVPNFGNHLKNFSSPFSTKDVSLDRVLIWHSISLLKWTFTSVKKCVLKCPKISVWNQYTKMCLHLNTQWVHLKHML